MMVTSGIGLANAGDNKSDAVSVPGDQLLTGDQTEQALVEGTSTVSLELPAGVAWPDTVPDFMQDPDATYEEGVVTAVTTFYWLCSWEGEYLSAVDEGDQASAGAALEEVGTFPRTEFFLKQFADPQDGWRKEILNPALAGDPSGIRAQFGAGDCAFFDEVNAR